MLITLIILFVGLIILSSAWHFGKKSVIESLPTYSEKPKIPLKTAKICLDCETIYEGSICDRCGSKFSWPVINWVGSMNDQSGMIRTAEGWVPGRPANAEVIKVFSQAGFTTA